MQLISKKDGYTALKYELGVSFSNKIVHVSPAYPGGFADINITRQVLLPKLPAHERVIADKGYQEDRILSPFKEYEGRALTRDQIEFNSALHSRRDIVERMNLRLKFFGCFSQRWRHGYGHVMHEICFHVACKLVNVMLNREPLNHV